MRETRLHACRALAMLALSGCGPLDVARDAALDRADTSLDASAPSIVCGELSGSSPLEDALGGRTIADRGSLLRCTHARSVSRADVMASPLFVADGAVATNGYELYVIQYVGEGRPGVARAMTALLYAPSGGAMNVPVAAVEHMASGFGPTCGPTYFPPLVDGLALPLVGRGFVVVAPDYAGEGVDNGMVSYLIGRSEAATTLDALRSLRGLDDSRFAARQIGSELFLVGHSQGGHAALFTQELFDPGIGLRLLGTIAFAPASAARPTGRRTSAPRPSQSARWRSSPRSTSTRAWATTVHPIRARGSARRRSRRCPRCSTVSASPRCSRASRARSRPSVTSISLVRDGRQRVRDRERVPGVRAMGVGPPRGPSRQRCEHHPRIDPARARRPDRPAGDYGVHRRADGRDRNAGAGVRYAGATHNRVRGLETRGYRFDARGHDAHAAARVL